MELNEAFLHMQKYLGPINEELGFNKKKNTNENTLVFESEKGTYRAVFNPKNDVLSFEASYENTGDETKYNTISQSLFELENIDDKEIKSISNEVIEEVSKLFATAKKKDLDKIKMPKAVSRTKAKNGMISYDVSSLANRFGVVYPEAKDEIKKNIANYGEFLPETYFQEHGTALVINTIKNGTKAEKKKLFKMLNEVYEDGTNEVQDIIGVTILGEMKNDPDMMATADEYMIEYMSGPVHEINKITAKNNKFTKKLANPPAYKPKKRKSFSLANAINDPTLKQ